MMPLALLLLSKSIIAGRSSTGEHGTQSLFAINTRQTIRFAYSSRFRPGHPATRKAATRFTAGWDLVYFLASSSKDNIHKDNRGPTPHLLRANTLLSINKCVKPLPCSLVLPSASAACNIRPRPGTGEEEEKLVRKE